MCDNKIYMLHNHNISDVLNRYMDEQLNHRHNTNMKHIRNGKPTNAHPPQDKIPVVGQNHEALLYRTNHKFGNYKYANLRKRPCSHHEYVG